jgi:hypothetical protein
VKTLNQSCQNQVWLELISNWLKRFFFCFPGVGGDQIPVHELDGSWRFRPTFPILDPDPDRVSVRVSGGRSGDGIVEKFSSLQVFITIAVKCKHFLSSFRLKVKIIWNAEFDKYLFKYLIKISLSTFKRQFRIFYSFASFNLVLHFGLFLEFSFL